MHIKWREPYLRESGHPFQELHCQRLRMEGGGGLGVVLSCLPIQSAAPWLLVDLSAETAPLDLSPSSLYYVNWDRRSLSGTGSTNNRIISISFAYGSGTFVMEIWRNYNVKVDTAWHTEIVAKLWLSNGQTDLINNPPLSFTRREYLPSFLAPLWVSQQCPRDHLKDSRGPEELSTNGWQFQVITLPPPQKKKLSLCLWTVKDFYRLL